MTEFNEYESWAWLGVRKEAVFSHQFTFVECYTTNISILQALSTHHFRHFPSLTSYYSQNGSWTVSSSPCSLNAFDRDWQQWRIEFSAKSQQEDVVYGSGKEPSIRLFYNFVLWSIRLVTSLVGCAVEKEKQVTNMICRL